MCTSPLKRYATLLSDSFRFLQVTDLLFKILRRNMEYIYCIYSIHYETDAVRCKHVVVLLLSFRNKIGRQPKTLLSGKGRLTENNTCAGLLAAPNYLVVMATWLIAVVCRQLGSNSLAESQSALGKRVGLLSRGVWVTALTVNLGMSLGFLVVLLIYTQLFQYVWNVVLIINQKLNSRWFYFWVGVCIRIIQPFQIDIHTRIFVILITCKES